MHISFPFLFLRHNRNVRQQLDKHFSRARCPPPVQMHASSHTTSARCKADDVRQEFGMNFY
jgi:hypothetical protein